MGGLTLLTPVSRDLLRILVNVTRLASSYLSSGALWSLPVQRQAQASFASIASQERRLEARQKAPSPVSATTTQLVPIRLAGRVATRRMRRPWPITIPLVPVTPGTWEPVPDCIDGTVHDGCVCHVCGERATG